MDVDGRYRIEFDMRCLFNSQIILYLDRLGDDLLVREFAISPNSIRASHLYTNDEGVAISEVLLGFRMGDGRAM